MGVEEVTDEIRNPIAFDGAVALATLERFGLNQFSLPFREERNFFYRLT
jgi:hypothetical protein